MCIKSMLIDQFVCLENIQIHVTKILLYVHVNIVRGNRRWGEGRGVEGKGALIKIMFMVTVAHA